MTYAQLRSLQSRGKYANLDPKVFAAMMGQMVGDPRVTESLANPSWGSRLEAGITGAVDSTGLPQAFGNAGQFLFGDTGRDVFSEIPRSAANLLPLAAGGPVGIGGAALMGGLQAWGDTEQAVPTMVGGALAGLTPGIAKVGGGAGVQAVRAMSGGGTRQLAGKFAQGGGAEVAETAERLAMSNLPRTGGELAGMVAGEQAALLGAGVAGDALSIGADSNRSMDELSNPAYWAAQALSNLPFVGFDVVQGRRAFKAGQNELAGAPMDLQQAWLRDQAARPFEGPAEAPVRAASPAVDPFNGLQGEASMWPPPALYPPTEGGGLLTGPTASPAESQQFLQQEAANVRPPELSTALQQRGEAAQLESGVRVEELPEETAAEFATKQFKKHELIAELNSGDYARVTKAMLEVMPDREKAWLGEMIETMRAQGVDQETIALDVANIGRSWAKSYLSTRTKTDVLGDKAPIDDTLSLSARQAWQQFNVNKWVDERRTLAETDEKVRGELELVDKVQKDRIKQQNSVEQTDRGITEAWPVYQKWVDSGSKGDLEKYLRSSLLKASNRDERVKGRKPSVLRTDEVSRDAVPENQRDAQDASEALKAVRDDQPDKVAAATERLVRSKAYLVQEAIWPQELLDDPVVRPVLDLVTEGLRKGNTAEQLMEKLRQGVDPETMLALANNADFAATMKRALAVTGSDRATIVKALDGIVDPAQRAEVEAQLQLRDIIDAEVGQEGVVAKLRAMLELFGANDADVARDLPTLVRLWNFSKAFTGIDLATLQKGDARKSAGLYAADAQGRRLVAARAERPEMLSWIVAHELTGHGLWDALDKGLLSPQHAERLQRFQNTVRALSPQERARMLQDAAASLPQRLRNDPEIQKLLESDLDHADANEVLANLNAIAALNLVSGKRAALRDQIRYLPKWFTDVYDVAAQYMRKMTDVMRGMVGPKERKLFDAHKKNLEAVMLEARANEVAAAQLALYERNTSPGGLRDIFANPDVAEANWRDLLDDPYGNKLATTIVQHLGGEDFKKAAHLVGSGAGRAGRWLAHTLQPPVQFGGYDKEFRMFANQQLEANQAVQQRITQLMGLLGASYDGTTTRLGASGPEMRLAKQPKVAEALNQAILAVQKPRGEGDKARKMNIEQALKEGDAAVMEAVKGLSNEELNLLKEADANRRQFHRQGMQELHGLNYEFAAAQAASTAMKAPTGESAGLSYEPVYQMMKQMTPTYKGLPWSGDAKVDAPLRMQFEQQVAAALQQTGMDPAKAAATAGAFEHMLNNADTVLKRQLAFDGYVNESRQGAYKVSFTVPKDSAYGKQFGYADADHGYASADSLEDAEFLRAHYEKQGLQGVKVVKPTDFEAQERLKMTSDLEDIITQETENLRQGLLARGMSQQDVKETIDNFDLLFHVDRDKVANKMGTLTITRRFAPGRESLNMGEQQVQHVQSLLRGAQRRINEAVFVGMTRDLKYADSPEAAAILTSWKNNMAPDAKLTQGIAKFGYFYALGLNMPNYAQEWVQGVTGFPTKLIDEGASWAQAYKFVLKAQKDTAKMQLGSKFLKGGPLDTSKLSADEASLIKDAMERGMLGNGMLAEVTADTIGHQYRKQKVAAGWLPDTPTTKFGEVADATFNAVTRLHSKFTAGSTSTALLSAYRFLRSKGMGHKDAQAKAYTLFNEGMMIDGRYNRPAGLWDVGSAKPVAAMISALQSFTSNTIASTINYARRAADGRLPKGERLASASALANQLLVQTAIAGLMGLPLVGPMMAVAEKSIGFDLQAELTKLAANMENPLLSGAANQIALRGLFRGFGGPDVGARYGLGNVMGLNENDGFSFENFFGPVGSALGRSVTGLGYLAKGDILSASAEVMPVALRKPLKLWSDDWQFRSKDGNLLLEDATAGEKIMYSLGLQPQRLSQARESYNMIKRAREREHKQEVEFSRDVADMLQKGDAQGAQQVLAQRADESDMDYEDLVERVVNAIETRTFQAQPTRGGTKQTAELDAALARGYGQNSPIDEVMREQFKAELAVLLGIEPNEKRLHEAAVIDEMRKSNPFLTVRQARILLDKQRRRSGATDQGLAMLTRPSFE
jgi:hypothetical protein